MSWLPTTEWVPYELLAGCILLALCLLALAVIWDSLNWVISGKINMATAEIRRIAEDTNEMKMQLGQLADGVSSIGEDVMAMRASAEDDLGRRE